MHSKIQCECGRKWYNHRENGELPYRNKKGDFPKERKRKGKKKCVLLESELFCLCGEWMATYGRSKPQENPILMEAQKANVDKSKTKTKRRKRKE